MPDRRNDRPDELRRKLLKSSVIGAGAFAAGHALPYVKPGSESFEGISSAYALQTPVFGIFACTAADADTSVPPGQVGNTGIVTNITASVTPIPPVGTQIDCTPTSTDPLNPAGNNAVAGTDAAGVANFPDFNMVADFPSPPLVSGAVVTFTHEFVDQATFGPSNCATDLTVILPPPPFEPPAEIDPCTAVDTSVGAGEVWIAGTVTSITATVTSQIPGISTAGIEIELTVTSTDPNNAAANSTLTAVTNASGVATFANFDMLTGWPNAPIAASSTVTFTFAFVDLNRYGTDTCDLGLVATTIDTPS